VARGSRRGAREAAALEALRRDETPLGVPTGQRVEDGFVVRSLPGSPGRTYRCPGCDQELPSAAPHVVAWPEGREDDRRHWHTACWSARGRRGAKLLRGRGAPKYG
jgi:hypothetical protein